MHMQPKQSTIVVHAEVASRKGIIHRLLQALAIPVFKNRLHRCRQISAVAAEGKTTRANPWLPSRCTWIGAEAVVKAPAENLLTQQHHFRLLLRIKSALKDRLVGIWLGA